MPSHAKTKSIDTACGKAMRSGFKRTRVTANRSNPNGGWNTNKCRPSEKSAKNASLSRACIEVKAVMSKAGEGCVKAEFEILKPSGSNVGHVWDTISSTTHANHRRAKFQRAPGSAGVSPRLP